MEVLAAVFVSSRDAEGATHAIRRLGGTRVDVLYPGTSAEELFAVPTTTDMPPVIKYLAMTLGGALGLGLGAALFLVVLDLPPALGIAGAVVFGAVGALILGTAGRGVDRKALEGLPADELFLYRDALRQGRTVVIARIMDESKKDAVAGLLNSSMPEDIDPAREDPEVGLRSAEDLRYDPPAPPKEPRQKSPHSAAR